MINKTYTDDTTLYASDINTIIANINANETTIGNNKADVETKLGNKVDKVTGKSLVADTEITRLSNVSNYANNTSKSTTNGNIKIDGTETTIYTHPSVNLVNDGIYGTLNGANKFPAIGKVGKIYIDTDTKLHYTWDEKTYILTNTNPHGTTKEDVGLSNVDNTKDIDKPISTLTQNALTDLSNKITILESAGTTINRPTPTYIGQIYFDTTLGKPIWCKNITTPIWVDSTGATV